MEVRLGEGLFEHSETLSMTCVLQHGPHKTSAASLALKQLIRGHRRVKRLRKRRAADGQARTEL